MYFVTGLRAFYFYNLKNKNALFMEYQKVFLVLYNKLINFINKLIYIFFSLNLLVKMPQHFIDQKLFKNKDHNSTKLVKNLIMVLNLAYIHYLKVYKS